MATPTERRLLGEVHRLQRAMRTAEEMLRKPRDPFVMVNCANYLNQERVATFKAVSR